MRWLIESLRHHQEIALFLVLAVGYGVGELRLGWFRIGPVLGVMIAGIALGQLNIPVSDALKNAFFMLFLFAVGYRTGPQFFQSLRTTGVKQIILTVVICGTGFGLSFIVAWLAGFDAGTAGGLVAGAIGSSAAFGSASAEISRLNVPEMTRHLLLAKGAASFAVCYLVSTIMVIWVLTKLGPRLLRVDLAKVCGELEQEMGLHHDSPGGSAGNALFATRAYCLPSQFDGKPVLELETIFEGYRVFVERLRRNGEIITPIAGELLYAGDRIALWGRREALIGSGNALYQHEIYDSELLDIGIVSIDVVVTRQKAGRTLGELASDTDSRGVFLQRLVRGGAELPFTLQTPIEHGDLLSVTGEKSHVDRLVQKLGYSKQPTNATDITIVSVAIFLGAMIGLPAVVIGGIQVSLTLFVGVLLGGLILGWLGSRYPRFGGIPEPALWLFDSLGLAGFLALVGLESGPEFVSGLKESGLVLIPSAVVIVVIPHVLGILVGRYLLRIHPGVLLGACAGAGISTPSLSSLIQTARSRVPALGYGVGYALGNVMLALGGSLMVRIIGSR